MNGFPQHVTFHENNLRLEAMRWQGRAQDFEAKLKTKELELHDFRQEVSDVVQDYSDHVDGGYEWKKLMSLIIPAPKPDPLVAALEGVTFDHYPPNDAKTIRAALDALGFEIREKDNE